MGWHYNSTMSFRRALREIHMNRRTLTIARTAFKKCISAGALTIIALCSGSRLAVAQEASRALVVQEKGSNQRSPAAKPEQSPAQHYFTDVVLINQNGDKMRFYSDLLQGKVVIINSFFGTCQGVCLPMNRNLEKVQEALGEHVGKDVHIISISVDPVVDTPASLKEYAKRLHARPGWYFLTGDKQDHLSILIIGNERTGLWKKALGLAPSTELVKIVESVLNDQAPSSK
jgi:cytochrome oxidase Cu insertion factor (SCO1/SenC/PrrC family)